MKKLLTLAAIVVLAATTHAAAVGWTIMGAANYKNNDYSLFVIGQNGVTDLAQITALIAADADVSSYAFASGSVAANGSIMVTATASGKTITYSGSGMDEYSAFAVIWNGDATEATYTSTVKISMDNDATSKTFTFGNQTANLTANSFAVVPEPTSGLLMLVGLAGLALRRRRA